MHRASVRNYAFAASLSQTHVVTGLFTDTSEFGVNVAIDGVILFGNTASYYDIYADADTGTGAQVVLLDSAVGCDLMTPSST